MQGFGGNNVQQFASRGTLPTEVTTNCARYGIDSKASQFTVHAFSSGLAAIVAHSPKFAIRDFSGEAGFNPDTFGEAFVRMKIKTSSLEIMDEVDAKHRRELERRMYDEVLETRIFPEIMFESAQVTANKVSENRYSASVNGKLTLHGVTKSHSFSTEVVVGADTIRGVGEFKVRQTAYGIEIPSFPGGTMRDDLTLAFYIVASRLR
jgi:polyisoprenoid-binding protein YceI